MNKYIAYLKNWRSHLKLISWISVHTKPYIPSLGVLLLINTLMALVSVGMSLLMKRMVDNTSSLEQVRSNLMLYVGVMLVALLFGVISTILGTLVNENFSYSIRRRVYSAVLHTRIADMTKYHSGDMLTRMTSDINTVANGITGVIPSLLALIVSFLAAFVTMLYFDWRLAIFAVILGPIAAVISIVMGRKVKTIQVKVQESESAYRSNMQETLENLVVIKSFEGQDSSEARLDTLQGQRMYWIKRRLKIGVISRTLLDATFQFGFIVIFSYSAVQLAKGAITVGTLMLFVSLVGQIQTPIADLAKKVPMIISVLASAERVQEVERLAREDTAHHEMAPGSMGIDICNLSFSYGGEDILLDATTTIPKGEFIALMGSSGIGKTTLIRLMMAFYLPQTGGIALVDAGGGRRVVTAGARQYISYVPQGNTLMSGTIADNLQVGKPDATEEEMWQALSVVSAAEFVRDAPHGLYSVIGERGLGLSEGQAQRIAIARALIKNAPVLILDEATSALDEQTELSVLHHLRQSVPRPTCVLITHRRSVLPFCDRCMRIHNKTVVEEAIS